MTCKPTAAALAAMLLLGACGSNDHSGNHGGNGGSPNPVPQPRYQAQIQRTAYGIPHIQADNEEGLGFGMGYAYAEDNFCLLAGEIATVNGERARYFGAGGNTSDNPEEAINNLESDFFFKAMNDDDTVLQAWQAQPAEVQALLRGYAAGVNRWLGEKNNAGLAEQCRNAAWVRPITERDLVRLMRRTALLGGALDLAPGIAAAQPPGAGNAAPAAAARPLPRRITASNGIAVGAEASADGGGLLLGQPHLPWGTMLRFWQVHLTIPGKMDVMGATLPGLPVVGIGFTKDFAWTHTTDTSAHFTVYQLELDPGDPTRYMVDGESKPLLSRTVTVQVKSPDGAMGTQTRTLYGTEYGPLLTWPGKLAWTRRHAYALRDANAANHRMLAQWHAMGKARTLAELKAVNLEIAGNPWNYTIAADRAGNTLLMNVSPVANVPDALLAQCMVEADEELQARGMHVLDGSRAACAWRDEPGAVQPGTVPPGRLPVLERRDFVQNANDSAWLSNPAAPLKGYPALVSRDGVPQGARTRMVLTELYELLRGKGQITADDLRRMALDDKAYLAPLLLPDLLDWCGTMVDNPAGSAAGGAELAAGCAGLAAWNGRAGFDAGLGMYHFTALAAGISENGAWRVPFDPADPVGTPTGVDHREPAIAQLLAETLGYTVRAFDEGGVPRDAKLGQVQVTRQGGKTLPIHGGSGTIGVLSATETEAQPRDGLFDVVAGTTYVQVVGFDGAGPRAQALLAYSQSSDPASPHARDQTELFSKGQWVALPFTQGEIAADPALRKRFISQ